VRARKNIPIQINDLFSVGRALALSKRHCAKWQGAEAIAEALRLRAAPNRKRNVNSIKATIC
jgi:hypothetical protein